MKRTRILSMVVVVLAMTPTAKAAPEEACTATIDLAGHNTITADSSAVGCVSIPTTSLLKVSQGDIGPVIADVEGDGRISGAALTSGNRVVGFFKLGRCYSPGCTQPPWLVFNRRANQPIYSRGFDTTDEGTDKYVELPAGTYALRVFADGSPVKVRFDLEGLDGEALVDDLTPASASMISSSAPRTPFSDDAVLQGGGRIEGGSSGRLVVSYVWTSWVGPGQWSKWMCRYPGGAPSGPIDPFAPGCPGAAPPSEDMRCTQPVVPYAAVIAGASIGLIVTSPCLYVLPAGASEDFGLATVTTGALLSQGYTNIWL